MTRNPFILFLKEEFVFEDLIQIGEKRTSDALVFSGLKMLVEIFPSTIDVELGNKTKNSLIVWAKVDTRKNESFCF